MRITAALVALLVLPGCSLFEDSAPIDTTALLPSFEADDRYEAGPDAPTTPIAPALSGMFAVGELLGFPEGNVLKVHDVCYDESLEQGYAAGIMTTDIAVFDDAGIVRYIDSGLPAGSYEIPNLLCGGGRLLLATDDGIVQIDPKSGGAMATHRFPGILRDNVAFDPVHSRVFVPTKEGVEVRSAHLVTFPLVASLALDRYLPVITEEGEFFAIVQDGPKSLAVEQYDAAWRASTVGTVPNVAGDLLGAAYDAATQELWVLSATSDDVVVYDVTTGRELARIAVVPDARSVEVRGEHAAVLTSNGFDDGTVGGFLGGVTIIDRETYEVRDEVQLPFKHAAMQMTDDALYVVNNDGNSFTRIALADGEHETVVVGASVEHGVATADGTLLLARRLGGNTVVHLDPTRGTAADIDLGDAAWPVGMAYDAAIDRAFTFDFLSATVSAIDPDTNRVVETYHLGIPEGESDAIGDAAYDATRGILYAAIPEQNRVVGFDVRDETTVVRLDLADAAGVDYGDLSGAGKLLVGVYEPLARLFVYSASAKTLSVYDGMNGFALLDTIAVSSVAKEFPYALVVDNAHDVVFIGDAVYDAVTLDREGALPAGDVVAAVDNDRGLLLTAGIDRQGQETLYILDREGARLGSIPLARGAYVSARFVYADGTLYALYMTAAEVWRVTIGEAP